MCKSTKTLWPKVTVVIVNWNGKPFIRHCLTKLLTQTVLPHEIILVDNASSDGSTDIVRDFPSVRSFALKSNLGFAGGNNLAFAAALPDSEWVAFLNPDTIPSTYWLEKLLIAANSHPTFEAFGSKLVSAFNPDILDGEGDCYHICGLAWRVGHGRATHKANDKTREIFSPCAAAAMYRRDVFQEVDGFDTDFFCYMEDVDLGFRLRLRGYRCLYVPESVVGHIGSGTTGGQHSDFAVYHGHRNLVWTYIKNMPGLLFWLFLPYHITINLVGLLLFSIKGQFMIVFLAKLNALRGLALAWNKRRAIQTSRRARVIDILKVMNKKPIPRLFE